MWRNTALPATLRQLSLVMGPVAVLCVPMLVLSAPLFLRLPLYIGLPRHVTEALVEAGLGYLMLVGGLMVLMAYRPPARFMPPWLTEDDEREGYDPPPPDWFDKFILALGILALVTSLVLWVAATVAWLAPSLIG